MAATKISFEEKNIYEEIMSNNKGCDTKFDKYTNEYG